ncbi:hypothetical protein [Alphaentomopoxvirus acuprea]|uniref:Uncharacterized protein n=1 Tax=Alphaentomopoxvirus acuprea TaxID=62099 RepID=W6JPM8_9POXV|nr:hypothetical protein BA82_gp194 [Anomala cuprea entomopoxvirus]BAO49554.1 hypothetical protein [Anomala cuprea entomopoxvirus]
MKQHYISLCETIIYIIKKKYSTMDFDEIDYESDFDYILKIFLNKEISDNFKDYNDSDWITSMRLIPLTPFSFYKNRKGDLKCVYNYADDEQRSILVTKYKELINELYIYNIKLNIINSGKEQINKYDSINIKLSSLISDSNNFKDPVYLSRIIDIIFYDEDTKDIIIDLVNKYGCGIITINDKESNMDHVYKIIQTIMNIHISEKIYIPKKIHDYINYYVNEIFNNSKFLKECIIKFSSNDTTKFKCNCNIDLSKQNILDCKAINIKSIKYIEKTGYKPYNIKCHIKDIIIVFVLLIVKYFDKDSINNIKDNIYNYTKEKSNNHVVNELFKEFINSDIYKFSFEQFVEKLNKHKSELQKIYLDNKHNIRTEIYNILNHIPLNTQQTTFIDEHLDLVIDKIDFNNIPNVDDKIKKFSNVVNLFIEKLFKILDTIKKKRHVKKYKQNK